MKVFKNNILELGEPGSYLDGMFKPIEIEEPSEQGEANLGMTIHPSVRLELRDIIILRGDVYALVSDVTILNKSVGITPVCNGEKIPSLKKGDFIALRK